MTSCDTLKRELFNIINLIGGRNAPHLKPNQMNTQENNQLIAEFMNLDMYPPHDDYPLLYDYSPVDQDPQWYAIEELQYHTSWDWLMPVVEKIESIGYEVITSESRCKIKHNTDHSIQEVVSIDILGTKIEATHQAVVEFIKWYNENK
jgi:hypothetical protein